MDCIVMLARKTQALKVATQQINAAGTCWLIPEETYAQHDKIMFL